MKLTDFKCLSFDRYGALIDWETGLYAALQPLLQRGGDIQAAHPAYGAEFVS